ncbi:unnamed protein product [Dicrocoelium dendriticum]|nr:unnamed protein product [Dicrocoelium dendriticum]
MIQSIFILTTTSDVLLEKHWGGISLLPNLRDVFDASLQVTSNRILVATELRQGVFIRLCNKNLLFVAVCANETPPLFVIEFLNRLTEIITEYFATVNELSIKENLVSIYEIIDEMVELGFPLTTESNILKDLIKPGNLFRSLTDAVAGKHSAVGSILPACQLSNVRWRRTGLKYTSNEVYFDLIEVVDAILDTSGSTVSKQVHGRIECLAKLTGMPDLTLIFSNHRIIEDASVHPCVRLLRWTKEGILSFIPPDGRFRLMDYRTTSFNSLALPLSVRHHIVWREKRGRLELSIASKLPGKSIDSVKLTMRLSHDVCNVDVTPSSGRYRFDLHTKQLEWDIGRLESTGVAPTLKGNLELCSNHSLPMNPSIMVRFSIPKFSASGLKIARVDLYNEKYKPFKGVKSVTSSGKFEVRA